MSDLQENNKMEASRADEKPSSRSFVVDIESFPTRSSEKEQSQITTSRILKSFSRKGSIHGGQKMSNSLMESPRGPAGSPRVPTSSVTVENHISSDHHHYVTITGAGPGLKSCPRRLSSGTRTRQSVFTINPQKVLFIFAALSSLGSLLLIYFTLMIKKMNEETGEWR